jgi:hypothetical protein
MCVCVSFLFGCVASVCVFDLTDLATLVALTTVCLLACGTAKIHWLSLHGGYLSHNSSPPNHTFSSYCRPNPEQFSIAVISLSLIRSSEPYGGSSSVLKHVEAVGRRSESTSLR